MFENETLLLISGLFLAIFGPPFLVHLSSIQCTNIEKCNSISERYPIKLNVYRLKDSSIGFYHSGVVFKGHEYTYCCGVGICYHKPKKCHFASYLGSICLGFVNMDAETFLHILQEMDNQGGFSIRDYDVMDRSCNTFTFELAKRLELSEKYPMAILKQSKMGEFLAPMVHAVGGVLGELSGSGSIVSEEDTEVEAQPSCFRKRQKSASSVKR